MRSKTMTISEFMELEREKELNKKGFDKKYLILFALAIILVCLFKHSKSFDNQALTAFLWSELQC